MTALALHGQTMPQARLFAEGTISVPDAFAVTFTPDGKAVVFAKRIDATLSHLLMSEYRDGKWNTPKVLGISTQYINVDPFLSPDGKQLFFASIRPVNGQAHEGPSLWVSSQINGEWGTPVPVIEETAKKGAVAVFPSPVESGTLYFAGHLLEPASFGEDDIYCARRVDGRYARPENVGPPVSTAHHEYDAFVAPDESYMIFASDRPGGYGKSDLYISVHRDGKWGTPVNLGPSVNSDSGLCCPAVSPDGKRFYFTTTLNGKQGIFEIDFPALVSALGLEIAAKNSGKVK